MARKPTKAVLLNLLTGAVGATQPNAPNFYATKDEMSALTNHEGKALVVYNEAFTDPSDNTKIAWRATAEGVAALSNGAFGKPTSAPAPTTPWGAAPQAPPAANAAQQSSGVVPPRAYRFDDGIPMPAPRRGGRGQNAYGFEHMTVGQSLFIPATGDDPNPSKRIASTVSSASKRLAPKQFMVRLVDETTEGRGKGARIWRTQ
jgi:hypothetical protein